MAHADGAKFPNPKKVFYHDGIFVGYRGFEKREIEPLFAFGHGLSYTTFEYSNLQLSATEAVAGNRIDETILEATVTITNTGDRAGKEVVQLYISDVESSVIRPKKELKGFEKVELQPGESKTITFSLTPEALAFYNENSSSWTVESGEYRVLIGASSADIRLEKSFTLR